MRPPGLFEKVPEGKECVLFVWNVNGPLFRMERCFPQSFRDRWVGVDGCNHFVQRQFAANGKRSLSDQVGGAGAGCVASAS